MTMCCVKFCNLSIEDAAVRVAETLRRRGLAVSQAEVVMLLKLIEAYSSVAEHVSRSELIELFKSVYAKRSDEEPIVEEVVKHVCGGKHDGELGLREALHADMRVIGARAGSLLRRSLREMNKQERAAFARLYLVGAIRRSRRGYYVVNASKLDGVARRLESTYGSYSDAVSGMIRQALAAHRLDVLKLLADDILDYINLKELTVGELISLYRVAGSRSTRAAVARALADKTLAEPVPRSLAEEVESILERHKLLSPDHAERLLTAEPRLATRIGRHIGEDIVLDIASKVANKSPRLAAAIVSKLFGCREAGSAFELLARMGKASQVKNMSTEELGDMATLSQAFESLMNFFLTGNEGYLDAAEFYAERAGSSNLELARSISAAVRAARDGVVGHALELLVDNMEPFEAMQLLSEAAARGDERLRRFAVALAYRVLRRAQEATVRQVMKPRLVETYSQGERIDTRKTLFMLVRRTSEPLVWLRRSHTTSLVLVLDKSGSMRRYSFYSLLVASALAPLVERLVVFDERPQVYGRHALRGAKWRRIIDAIVSTRFEGYTDIVAALEAATMSLTPRKLVLVTDMRQTVRRSEEPVRVLERLASRGWKLNIVLPAEAAAATLEKLSTIKRLRVFTVKSVDEASRVVTRIALRG